MNIRKVLEYALQREYEGKAFFEKNADRLSNASASGAFKIIAKEEQRHIEYIQAHLDALDTNEPVEQAAPELDEVEILSGRAASEMIEQSVSESMVADLPVLRMAYLIERDFAEFYEQAASKAEGEAKATLEMLARWEAGHERLFKRMHDEAFEKYTEMPWGG
ncbi:MAG: ferritin family protein [Anaerolineae bacterium]|jgi:rubrerythrin|nr:ferritin family protein [Anaerolineae bacterium]MBT7781590.1 ferritin family protein [Anaerolineae bacterium]